MRLSSVHILFFLLGVLVTAPTNNVWACGSEHAGGTTKSGDVKERKSCCKKTDEARAFHVSDSAPCDEHRHSSGDCPCDHEHGGCHCPGCGLIASSGASFALPLGDNFQLPNLLASVRKAVFYFIDHLPEAVFLPIWQPPKIGV